MKIKEIRIAISYPYQLAPYLVGKIELEEIIILEEETAADIEAETIKALIKRCKQGALDAFSDESISEKEQSPPTRRHRKF
jgi:hypothetical protein